jgi:hypothetical protein
MFCFHTHTFNSTQALLYFTIPSIVWIFYDKHQPLSLQCKNINTISSNEKSQHECGKKSYLSVLSHMNIVSKLLVKNIFYVLHK